MIARLRTVAWALATLVLVPAAAASAAPPSDPDCVALGAGSTGVIFVGGQVPSQDQLSGARGGFGPVASDAIAGTLPEAIGLKSNTETFSTEDAFALRGGHMYVRPATLGRGDPKERWHELELPACLDGKVRAISADGRLLLAVTQDGQLYAHDMPGGDLSPDRWTWRWGPYFWTGQGIKLFGDIRTFAASEFTSAERFDDSAGRTHAPIGVATVYLLRGDGRRITYLDPWLPTDESREVCGPRRGTVRLAGLSGSGSTVFVVSTRGEFFTRLYDFDVSGANTVFGTYTWQTGLPPTDSRWQMPGPVWVRHARPPGRFTDRISIFRTGTRAMDRVLRVEGQRRGKRGYWEKALAGGRHDWTWHTTGAPRRGRWLPRGKKLPALVPDDRRYAGTIAGAPAELQDFNPECSPAHLRVDVAPGEPLDLIVHSSDGLRQDTRAHGLDDTPREYNGAVEIPEPAFAALAGRDARVRAWVDANLGGKRISTAPIAVTSTRVKFLAQCWELTLDGRPARPDVPRVPPDLGAAFARAMEERQDGRGPSAC